MVIKSHLQHQKKAFSQLLWYKKNNILQQKKQQKNNILQQKNNILQQKNNILQQKNSIQKQLLNQKNYFSITLDIFHNHIGFQNNNAKRMPNLL
jgi:hypothetical protein